MIDQKQTLTERTTKALSDFIRQESLEPGDKLPTEQNLCALLNVSRTVVREAISRLKAEGILTSRRGSGIFVAAPDNKALQIGAPQNLVEVLDMLELRTAVEVESARLAAGRMTAAGLIQLDRAMADFEEAVSQWQRAAEADLNFHAAIAAASGNAQFERFLHSIATTAIPRRSLDAQFPDDKARTEYLQSLVDEHAAIHSAILARDPEEAANAMRVHLEGSRRRYGKWRSETDGVESPLQGTATA